MSYKRSLLPLMAVAAAAAQTPQVPKVVPVPPLPHTAPPKEPTDPPAQDVSDTRDRLTFHLPPGWNLSKRDGEISTFRLDARNAPRRSQFRMVASLAFNPYPQSTFEGALFYVSSTSAVSPSACAAQTTLPPFKPLPPVILDGVSFASGKDEHGHICTESRDIAYTAPRNGVCLRFDLAINSFCGGEVSGAQDLTESQFEALFARLQAILDSVKLTK